MLSKETFIKAIDQIKRHRDIECKINDATKDFNFMQFQFGDYEDVVVRILEDAMEDTTDNWIGYWIYELDFGNDYYKGSIVEIDGTPIKLSTSNELYDFLLSNMKKKCCKTCKHQKDRRCTSLILLNTGAYWSAGSCKNWEGYDEKHTNN